LALAFPLFSCSSLSSSGPPFIGRVVSVPRHLLPSVRLYIDGDYAGMVNSTGHFHLNGIQPGMHYVEVSHPQFVFPSLRVEFSPTGDEKVWPSLASSSSPSSRLPSPISVAPIGPAVYFAPREPFNPWSLLKNPMVIMMLVTAGMVFIFPRMMSNMDPKEVEEMRKMQANMSLQGLMKNIQEGDNKKSK